MSVGAIGGLEEATPLLSSCSSRSGVGRDVFRRRIPRWDRAARNPIRRACLWTDNLKLLATMLSLLTAGRDRFKPSSLESVVLWPMTNGPMDAPDFFAHLELDGCKILSWDRFLSQTILLTTLDLSLDRPAPTSQLFSILISNPHLQNLMLPIGMAPLNSGGSSFRVALRHLKRSHLIGCLSHLFGFLCRLEYRIEDYHVRSHHLRRSPTIRSGRTYKTTSNVTANLEAD